MIEDNERIVEPSGNQKSSIEKEAPREIVIFDEEDKPFYKPPLQQPCESIRETTEETIESSLDPVEYARTNICESRF